MLLPQLQEVNALPCDTGSPRDALEADAEFSGLSFELLTPDWTSKRGIYDPANVAERATWVRRWLRDRAEDRIVGEQARLSVGSAGKKCAGGGGH